MSGFDELNARLQEATNDHRAAMQEGERARAALARLERERALLVRASGSGRAREVLARLDQAIAEHRRALRDARAAAARHRQRVVEVMGELAAATDPRKAIDRWTDDCPILLLPYRLETRFAERETANGLQHELRVRVYPDVCAIDTFEEQLSDAELRSARRYWLETWRAGGDEQLERAAWRSLVVAHGSGRAGWIVERFRPANPGDAEHRTLATDVILVVPADALPTPDEQKALRRYWTAAWRAAGAAEGTAALQQLEADVGDPAQAASLVERYRPFNLADRPAAPLTPKAVAVKVTFLQLPANVAAPQAAWNRAPHVEVLPERFVLLATSGPDVLEPVLGNVIPSPLVVGPDPAAPPEDQLKTQDDRVVVPEELLWTTDFRRAVEWGMGFVVSLTAEQYARGVDRLLVVGLRITSESDGGRKLLESLLTHHRDGRTGLAIVPQGTPTNNTESGSTSFSRVEEADATFALRARGPTFVPTTDAETKPDGQWLTELLGLDPAALRTILHGDATDQREAGAMARALWPATGGYFLDTMMHPIVSASDVAATRTFFTAYVSGRGWIPAIRIGNEPYGILPATAFSRIRWLARRDGAAHVASGEIPFPARLFALLRKLDTAWSGLADRVTHVGQGRGDPHQILLDVLGLHPTSVTFRSRTTVAAGQLHDELNLWGFGLSLEQYRDAIRELEGQALLQSLGYPGGPLPFLFEQVYSSALENLSGPLVDDRPLSERDAVRVWTSDGLNYLEKLAASARASLDQVRTHAGYVGGKPPTALLYLLLRHGLLLGYHGAALELHGSSGVKTAEQLAAMRREPTYVHVVPSGESESRWAPLLAREVAITGSADRTVAEHVTATLGVRPETAALAEQIAAIEELARVPTARLERLLAEHLDCWSYRLDAWLLGIVHMQLSSMRAPPEPRQPARRGVYLGGYGWLEHVRPEPRRLEPAQVPEALRGVFVKPGEAAPMRDGANGGYIHAPSLNHALTAAVLRSGYLANAGRENPETLAVDLSSERVRLALGMLEGMRTGQSLSALLGYRLERALHDRHAAVELDEHIYVLRQAYPLRANRLHSTRNAEAPVEVLEARNVVDGLALVRQARTHLAPSGRAVYPFGDARLPPLPQAAADAIGEEVDALLEIHDALGDLGLAESVHQAVQGNFDRAAGTLDTFTVGAYPPEPDVVRTPVTGIGITHRVALHLEAELPLPGAGATPRAIAEPALDRWLRGVLPPLDRIACTVAWTAPDGTPRTRPVTLAELGYGPLDVLYVLRTQGEQAMRELDDRVLARVIATEVLRADATLSIRYMECPADHVSVFQAMPLVAHLRSAVLRARPLRASDAALESEASSGHDAEVFVHRERIAKVLEDLETLGKDAGTFLAAIGPLVADPVANRAALLAGVDAILDGAVGLLARGARFGIAESGYGFALEWRRTHVAALVERVRARVARWEERLAECQRWLDREANLEPGATDAERLAPLQRAELLVSTASTPPPIAPAALRTIVEQKRDTMGTRRDQLTAAVDGIARSASAALAAVTALLPMTQLLDTSDFSVADLESSVLVFAADLERAVESLARSVEERRVAGKAALDAHDTAAAPGGAAEALGRAAQALLGEDFRILPEFVVPERQGEEWRQALAAATPTDAAPVPELFAHLVGQAGVDLPIDEWLAGVARVRAPMRAWEQAGLLAGGFRRPEPKLQAIQLPFRPADHWLGLQIPDDYDVDGSRLLYTAHYAVPFDATKRLCGLLLDEWTEVIPGGRVETDAGGVRTRDQRETTGIALHFDRPNSEAPQAMLLVTPATWSGRWQWADVVEAVVESFDLARKRAVEPRHVAETELARLVPATILASALRGISISTPLAVNNDVYAASRMG